MNIPNHGFIADSQDPGLVPWEAPIITQVQRDAFNGLRGVDGMTVTEASPEEWDAALARLEETYANVSKEEIE